MDTLPPTSETFIPVNVEETPEVSKNNSYASKKSVAQRMMDIALLTSNANQLRYVLQFGNATATYIVAVCLIALSLALQIAVGIYLIFRVTPSTTKQEKDKAHSVVVAGVFMITIVNVLVTAFSLEPDTPAANPAAAASPFSNRFGNLTATDEP